jgi:Ca-activated chloride channel family protein
MQFQITFENPTYLWYLISIPLLVYTHFYLLRHTKQKALKFANFDAIKRVTGEKIITKNITVLFVRILIITCMIFAVAGTTFWYEGKVSQNDFVIAIDTSASMTAQDIKPDRLEAAKKYATTLIDGISERSNIGIITFAGTTFIETTPINNKETLKTIIEMINITNTGGTDIAGAIITGANMLLPPDRGKTIIIITDGSNTVSAFMQDSIDKAIEYAKENHVVVHSIGMGSESGPLGYLPEYYNISAIYSEDNLFKISNATNGKYVHILNNEDIPSATGQIERETEEAMMPVHLNYGLMLIVLFALFLEWGFISTRFRRIP